MCLQVSVEKCRVIVLLCVCVIPLGASKVCALIHQYDDYYSFWALPPLLALLSSLILPHYTLLAALLCGNIDLQRQMKCWSAVITIVFFLGYNGMGCCL